MVDCHHKDNPSHFQTVSYTDFKLKEKRAAVLARHHQIPRFEVSVSVSGEKKMYDFSNVSRFSNHASIPLIPLTVFRAVMALYLLTLHQIQSEF